MAISPEQQQFIAQALMKTGAGTANVSPLASVMGNVGGAFLGSTAMGQEEQNRKDMMAKLLAEPDYTKRTAIAAGSSDPTIQKAAFAAMLAKPQGPYSDAGKIQADITAGRLPADVGTGVLKKMSSNTLTPYQQAQLDMRQQQMDLQKNKQTSKPLPIQALKDLQEKSAMAEGYGRLLGGFKDDFAGYKSPMAGDIANTYKRTFGDNTGQGQWWQDYQAQSNVIRNKLFGSALTETEKGEYDKATINPGMNPTQIKQNLTRQRDVVGRAINKLSKAYEAGGYNAGQIQALAPQDQGSPDMALPGNALPMSDAEKAVGTPYGSQPLVSIPDTAIQHLKQNPQLAPLFEQKYGVSSQQYLQQ